MVSCNCMWTEAGHIKGCPNIQQPQVYIYKRCEPPEDELDGKYICVDCPIQETTVTIYSARTALNHLWQHRDKGHVYKSATWNKVFTWILNYVGIESRNKLDNENLD